MKNLYYKGEFFKQITEGEADSIANRQGMHVELDGDLLKKSQIEIMGGSSNERNKPLFDYTTEELKQLIGNFEKEYNENATGEIVHNDILGPVKAGTVNHAVKSGAITGDGKFILLPRYREYNQKHLALRELIGRRDYARSANKIPDLGNVVKSFN